MDYLIVEEFNRFWELFAVNERLFPHRRACTLNLWMKTPPYFFVQDFGRSRTSRVLSRVIAFRTALSKRGS